MEDNKIVDLYFERTERAIEETRKKYGKYCRGVASNILASDEDIEECLNDTYLTLWERIPPERPDRLGAYAAKVTRNHALTRYDYNRAKKRSVSCEEIADEFFEVCDGGQMPICDEYVLKKAINDFLASLDGKTRTVFMKRYWYGMKIKDIAREMKLNQSSIKVMLFRQRERLKVFLEKEGVIV